MSEVIDIFVGADRSQLLAVAVLEHSIRRHTMAEVRVAPLVDLDLPEPEDLRQGSRTNFSFARFAIPELKNYEGRALYLDADMLVFRDIAALWSLPFEGATAVIQEESAQLAAAPRKRGAPAKRIRQSAVMLIDCAKARWDVREIVAGLDGRYTYEQLMHEFCILSESELRLGVPFVWNSLEHYELETRLIHYTDMDTQPWVSPQNRFGHLWVKEVLLMLETDALGWRDLKREIELGYFRPSLLTELEEMPHEAGFDQAAAKRYEAADNQAGFVKHAEVYARKRARAAAINQREAVPMGALDGEPAPDLH
jgi:lipopolysaccharide biosynthesis glycosyltransferase